MNADLELAPVLYLDLLKKCLTRYIFREKYQPIWPLKGTPQYWAYTWINRVLALRGLVVMRHVVANSTARDDGRDWPAEAETMVGLRRLDNLQMCVTDVLRRGVAGDLIETGVWRGGSCIFMRAILKAYGDTSRTVWVADSFQGLPKGNPDKYPHDTADRYWKESALAVSLETVKGNFSKYGLLDDQVRFLPGWFNDTLPTAPIQRLAVLRLDGDMYQSTMEALVALYPKVSSGGYVIVDDYTLPECRAALEDYRREHHIVDELLPIDSYSVYWQKS